MGDQYDDEQLDITSFLAVLKEGVASPQRPRRSNSLHLPNSFQRQQQEYNKKEQEFKAKIHSLQKELEALKESTDNEYAVAVSIASKEKSALKQELRKLQSMNEHLVAEKQLQQVHIDNLTNEMVVLLEEKKRLELKQKNKNQKPAVEDFQGSFDTWRIATKKESPKNNHKKKELEKVEQAFENFMKVMRLFQMRSKEVKVDVYQSDSDLDDVASLDSSIVTPPSLCLQEDEHDDYDELPKNHDDIAQSQTQAHPNNHNFEMKRNKNDLITNLAAVLQESKAVLEESTAILEEVFLSPLHNHNHSQHGPPRKPPKLQQSRLSQSCHGPHKHQENLQHTLVQAVMDRKKQQKEKSPKPNIWISLLHKIIPEDEVVVVEDDETNKSNEEGFFMQSPVQIEATPTPDYPPLVPAQIIHDHSSTSSLVSVAS